MLPTTCRAHPRSRPHCQKVSKQAQSCVAKRKYKPNHACIIYKSPGKHIVISRSMLAWRSCSGVGGFTSFRVTTWLVASWLEATRFEATWFEATWFEATWFEATWLVASWLVASWFEASWFEASWLVASWLEATWLGEVEVAWWIAASWVAWQGCKKLFVLNVFMMGCCAPNGRAEPGDKPGAIDMAA